jgi:hypothetical protein
MKHIKPYKIFESTSPNFPTTKEEVIEVCERHRIKNYTINDDLSIDVDGNVDLSSRNLEYLPLRFNYIEGSFDCSNNELKTLEGCPQTVGGDFDCYSNELKSLEGSPKTVGVDFYCYKNELKDLEHFPEVSGTIDIEDNIVYCLVYTFINKADSFMIEDFNDYEIVRNRDTVMLDRLQTFIRDNDLEMPDLEEIKKEYKIIE